MQRPVWFAVLVVLLAACDGTPPADSAAADSSASGAAERTLRIGLGQYPASLHPLIETMVAKYYVLGMAQRPLTRFDHDWQPDCALCATLPTIANGLAVPETTADGKAGLAVTWTLPEDAQWGDGEPVTSDDFVFTWEAGRHPQSGFIAQELWRMIQSIDVIDDHRFVTHLDRRTFGYNGVTLAFYALPEHLERPIFEASPADYRTRTLYQTDPTNPGLYNGPYRISEVSRGSHVTLVHNDVWHGAAPFFETVVVRAIERTTTLEANLLSGTIDMIAGELGLQVDQALAFRERHGDRYRVVFESGLLYEHIDLNLDNPVLADVRVRRALMYAMDRAQVTRELFGGEQEVAASFVHPQDFGYATEGVPAYAHDPARAAALLEESGWALGGDGIRRNARGEPLQLTIMSTAGDKTRELVEQVLQSQWRASGIDVRIRNEAPRIFFGETTRKRGFDAMALFAWASAPEPVPRTTLHSTEIPREQNGWSGQNYSGFSDPDMDALIAAMEEELDPEARRELWVQMQRIYASELPILPLYFRSNPHVHPPWLQGVRPTGHIVASTAWIEEWSRRE